MTSRGRVYRRRQKILALLKMNTKVFVNDLAETCGVSPITIRRDLLHFEQLGVIDRFEGGASYVIDSLKEESYEPQLTPQKEEIARVASEFVNENDLVYINSGSTAFLIINYLAGETVRIITNNGRAIEKSSDYRAEIILSGGEIYNDKKSLVGDIAINTFQNDFANICFLGVGGIDVDGVSSFAIQETIVNKTIIDYTDGPRIAVAEGNKVGHRSNFHTADLSFFSHLITDSSADEKVLEELSAKGIEIIISDHK